MNGEQFGRVPGHVGAVVQTRNVFEERLVIELIEIADIDFALRKITEEQVESRVHVVAMRRAHRIAEKVIGVVGALHEKRVAW